MWQATDAGAPRGGVSSPLFVALSLSTGWNQRGELGHPRGTCRGTYALVRYADAGAICLSDAREGHEAKTLFGPRGSHHVDGAGRSKRLSALSAEGCDFPRVSPPPLSRPPAARSGSKLLSTPSPGSSTPIKRTLQGLWQRHVGSPTVALINEMHPVSRGWSHSSVLGWRPRCSQTWDTCMYERAQRSMKRRHHGKRLVEEPAGPGTTIGPRQGPLGLSDKGRHATAPDNSPGPRLSGIGSSLRPLPRCSDPPGLLATADAPDPRPTRLHIEAFARHKGLCGLSSATWKMRRQPPTPV